MIITLMTDFGLTDPFVGIMKGVILGIAPDAQLVDITHEIPSYDVAEAAFLLQSTCRYFPPGTIHLVVVDPGVGSARRPLAAQANEHFFVAPDNGVLDYVLYSEPPAPFPVVHRITNNSLFRTSVGNTFHGRDIFAPVAAHLARGMPIEHAGPRILDFNKRPLPHPRPLGYNTLRAKVLRIDKYGNIVTNLRRGDIGRDFTIRIAGLDISRLCHSFSEAEPGEFFAIEGSTGYIEIALNRGAAADRLGIARGAEFEVETASANH